MFDVEQIINKLRSELIAHEAYRRFPYRDSVGKLTIGIGRNLDDVGIDKEEAIYLADRDIYKAVRNLNLHLPWWRELDAVRAKVLVNMMFNMGPGSAASGKGLLSFVNTLTAIERGNYYAAAKGMLASKWARQVKGRAVSLARMMETGKEF